MSVTLPVLASLDEKSCPRWIVVTPDYVISDDGDPAEPVSLMCNLLPGHDGSHFDQEAELWWLPGTASLPERQ